MRACLRQQKGSSVAQRWSNSRIQARQSLHALRAFPGLAPSTVLSRETAVQLRNLKLTLPVTWSDYPGSVVVIRPLALEWHAGTADLLTEAFVESKQYHSYKYFLKQRITSYLSSQVKLLPQTIILTAVLQQDVSHPDINPNDEPYSWQANEKRQSVPTADNSNYNKLVGLGNHLNSTISTVSSTSAASRGEFFNAAVTTMANCTNSDSVACLDSLSKTQHSFGSSRTVAGDDFSVNSALHKPDTQQAPTEVNFKQKEMLLGTAEVSFDRITHSTHLTLQPPRKCAYLCNMAVSPDWRRRGIGMMLIQGVEEACRIAGEQDLYLHLRFQDAPAAALYKAAGFKEVKSDGWWVKLIGRDQSRLMYKCVDSEC